MGQDFSGIVTAVGDDVTRFSVGDHVVGMAFMSTYSEYILLDESAVVAAVPKELDLVPLGGFFLAWPQLMVQPFVMVKQKLDKSTDPWRCWRCRV